MANKNRMEMLDEGKWAVAAMAQELRRNGKALRYNKEKNEILKIGKKRIFVYSVVKRYGENYLPMLIVDSSIGMIRWKTIRKLTDKNIRQAVKELLPIFGT